MPNFMIKYIELTAPEASAYRQCKILSIECQENDAIEVGQTLFMVKSGSQEIELPATHKGRIVEMIAEVEQSISISTPLLLLETEVEQSSTSTPLAEADQDDTQTNNAQNKKQDASGRKETSSKNKSNNKKKTKSKTGAAKKKKQQKTKHHQQQSLDLLLEKKASDQPDPTMTDNTSSKTTAGNAKLDNLIELRVPDIGADSAKVIEILVAVGDPIEQEQAVVTLESDKASMDVPSTDAGIVKEIIVAVDDDVSEGSVLITISSDKASEAPSTSSDDDAQDAIESQSAPSNNETAKEAKQPKTAAGGSLIDVVVPDIGGDSAKVIEILVNPGDHIEAEDSMVTLESDKASMDVPSPYSGEVKEILLKIDQDVSEGDLIATLASDSTEAEKTTADTTSKDVTTEPEQTTQQAPAPTVESRTAPEQTKKITNTNAAKSDDKSHASPSIRRFARELGVDLSRVQGSGRKNRVLKDDVKAYVKTTLSSASSGAASVGASASNGGAGIPAVPAQDFSKFGEIDVQPLNKIKRLTATNLHRSWLNVPHVTHNDEANITELEAFRKKVNDDFKKRGESNKVSPLAFIVKAMVRCLREYPQFNASLEPGGENLIYKKYFNIGIAVDTPNGLVVPVVKGADQLSVSEIAAQMSELAAKARDKKLSISDMSGACITISSLGGIGGTSFTPIVNAPEVAILGVSRSKIQPVWNGESFDPGLMLPLSLSYDHRVIDGAEAARFTRHLADVLEDVRLLTI